MTSLFSGHRRYLALWFPFLPTDRLRRQAGGKPDDRPLVITAKVKSALRIAHADRKALSLGLTRGLTLADARARVPDIAIAEEDPEADALLLRRIASWCDRFTPLVGLDGDSGIMLDITGCVHLFGGEAAMRAEVTARLGFLGLAVQSAIAGTPDAARAVASFTSGGIVAPGEEPAAVRPLPVTALRLDATEVLTLARAGLKTIADLADRPRAPLAARFGADLLDRLTRALGEVDHPISPNRPVPELMVEQRFAEPIGRAEDVSATLAGLAQELSRRLERQGLGGRSFEASFFRADGAVRRIRVASGRPLRDPPVLNRLFAEKLDALADPVDPGFGFDMIRLAALATEPMQALQARFDGKEREDEAVAELVDRLSARFGAERVMQFVAEDSHIPERSFQALPALAPSKDPKSWPDRPSGEPPVYPIRLFEPPQPIEAMAEVPDGPPIRFLWRRVVHDVVAAEGPDRIAPEWWQRQPQTNTRDYFRVEDREGHRFWLFREGLYEREVEHPRWYLHGLFA
ncbi:DNA-directed DNA polymerase [Agaricicola taiwanensis]|uniref:DNA-directed DNA polymerase n=1 Tax=Agaricicola taiwanensis TaxID=591372 RepID=A0A8J2VVE4_9RHOB|nr:DNA polymerase Y family protein [Agaricicola taiwanensis]GGE41388.1 DNA-directed DNA polymerase [Agaricicola taiwanensis]